MKKLIISLVLVAATMMSANAMSKYRASREARFLTDKMAWELDLTPMQMEDVYEINYDYFRSLVDVHHAYMHEYEIRNEELRFVLTPWQWERFIAREYFYIPVRVLSYAWVFPIHNYYHHDHFFFDAPHAYSHYKGGHAFNTNYYRVRIDIHHPGGAYRPAPAPKPEPKPIPRVTEHGHNRPNVGTTHNRQINNGNAKPNNPNNGNVKPNNNGGAKPNNNVTPRTTPNRSNSQMNNSRQNSRSNASNTNARPTRSQSSSQSSSQNSSRSTTSSGRR